MIRELDALKIEKNALVVERSQLVEEIDTLKLKGEHMTVVNHHVRITTDLAFEIFAY